MLSPDARSIYTSAVSPPPGYVFDQALATTYSLDPATLLTLPTHLALAARSSDKDIDPILLLESLRRLAGRFSIYVDLAGMKPPSNSHVLYGLLESMVTPVQAPRGGVFHPKMWIIRFVLPDSEEPPLLRLLVLSRNITFDRSWDISLSLEGVPQGRNLAGNRALGKFIEALPSLSTHPVPHWRRRQASQLADEVRKTRWELPEGYESVAFRVLGMDGKKWEPPWAKRTALISPFVTEGAISRFWEGTDELTAVVSRPDELNGLPASTMEMAGAWYALDDAAETEDGEESEEHDTFGLHAKAYVLEKGWRTHLFLGSANATNAALIKRSNVELLAEIVGRTSQVGGIDDLMGEDGLGSMLTEYQRPEDLPEKDEDELRARKALEDARDVLATADLRVRCVPVDNDWTMDLVSSEPLKFEGIAEMRAWPISVAEDRGVDALDLVDDRTVHLGRFGTASVTGIVAFNLSAEAKKLSLRLALNLPVDGLPENRDDAILRLVLNNREGFLRYLLLLLGEFAGDVLGGRSIFAHHGHDGSWRDPLSEGAPLLEEFARAFSRDPGRLEDVERVVQRLLRTDDAETAAIIPPKFLELWEVFKTAMAEAKQ